MDGAGPNIHPPAVVAAGPLFSGVVVNGRKLAAQQREAASIAAVAAAAKAASLPDSDCTSPSTLSAPESEEWACKCVEALVGATSMLSLPVLECSSGAAGPTAPATINGQKTLKCRQLLPVMVAWGSFMGTKHLWKERKKQTAIKNHSSRHRVSAPCDKTVLKRHTSRGRSIDRIEADGNP